MSIATISLPSQEYLNEVLRYDPCTGLLFWRARSPIHFSDGLHSAARKASQFNAMYAGKEAFTYCCAGYRVGTLDGKRLKAHRVIWKMVTGEEPPEIDHKDQDRANNRLKNLRASDRSSNQRNAQLRRSNTSGCMGVQWCQQRRKWKAFIRNHGRRVYLGAFSEKEAAIAARRSAERTLGYGENHGRAA